jgi:hypothetical protein
MLANNDNFYRIAELFGLAISDRVDDDGKCYKFPFQNDE